MSIPAYVYNFFPIDYHTEAFNSVIDEEIPAQDGHRLALIDFEYLNDTTAHLASFMYANDAVASPGSSRNTNLAAIVSGVTEITTVVAPMDPAGNVAANLDICAYQLVDGTWEFNVITGIAGSVLTIAAVQGVDAGAGAAAVALGAKIMIFGVIADGAVQNISLPVSVVTRKGEGRLGRVHPHMGEPWYLSIDNPTAQGFLMSALCAYINK